MPGKINNKKTYKNKYTKNASVLPYRKDRHRKKTSYFRHTKHATYSYDTKWYFQSTTIWFQLHIHVYSRAQSWREGGGSGGGEETGVKRYGAYKHMHTSRSVWAPSPQRCTTHNPSRTWPTLPDGRHRAAPLSPRSTTRRSTSRPNVQLRVQCNTIPYHVTSYHTPYHLISCHTPYHLISWKILFIDAQNQNLPT